MRKKYPFVKQLDIKDCGVACISMIIKYYGGNINYSIIKNNLFVDKSGTNAFNIVNYGTKIGFESIGLEMKFNEITSLNLPCIAYTYIGSYKHFVVIYEITKKFVIVGDPASGIKKMSFVDFDSIYQNVILTFNPIHKIPYEKNQYKLLKLIKFIVKSESKYLIKTLFLSLFITLLFILSSLYLKLIISNTYNNNILYVMFIIFLFIELLKIILNFIRSKLTIKFNNKLDYILTYDVFKKLLFLPYSFYKNKTTGEVISRYNDLNKIKSFISKIVFSIFIDLILSIVVLFLLFIISNQLTSVLLITILIYILFIKFINKTTQKKLDIIKQEESLINSYIVEVISGFESIKGTNLEENIMSTFSEKYNKYLITRRQVQMYFLYETTFKNIIYYICNITILFLGSLMINKNMISIGNFIFYELLLNYFLAPFNNILNIFNDYKDFQISIKRLEDIFIGKFETSGIKIDKINKIELKQLSYLHNNVNQLLKNINLEIKSKEKIIITGKSGSGKSTLLKVIKSYYKNNKIFINDIEINKIYKSCLNKINYVSQNEILFTDTIYNNIIMNREIDYSHFLKIARLFKIDKIINDKKMSYDYLIEENGFNLSGGEKQRIILARNFIVESDVYLLDESLSQVDTSLEKNILENILKIYNNKTIVFVSHRLDNQYLFDRLIEIDNKEIVKDIKR